MKLWMAIVVVAILAAIGSAVQISLWKECKQSHSWLYCAHTLSK